LASSPLEYVVVDPVAEVDSVVAGNVVSIGVVGANVSANVYGIVVDDSGCSLLEVFLLGKLIHFSLHFFQLGVQL